MARWGGSHRSVPVSTLAASLVVAVALSLSGSVPGTATSGEPTRLVLSSLTSVAAATSLSTKTLYARNDPWKKYLGSEQACPGGERTDLPRARQAATVACLINFARHRRGLRPLTTVAILSGASALKARAILRCGNFAHNPCGGDWEAAVRSTGYVGAFGENLYLASGPFGAPRPTVDAWLNSAPHRENLFRAEWREQGLTVLVLPRVDGRNLAVWVNVLGDRKP